MFDPFAIMGGYLGAAGSIYEGEANAGIANYNAEIADQNAQIVIAQGAEEARRSIVNSRKMIGSESAAYGASGVGNTGSAQWVMRSSAAQGELNSLTIKNNAQVKQVAYQNEAALDRMRAKNAEIAGGLGAASSLLKGFSGGFGGGDGGGGGLESMAEEGAEAG